MQMILRFIVLFFVTPLTIKPQLFANEISCGLMFSNIIESGIANLEKMERNNHKSTKLWSMSLTDFSSRSFFTEALPQRALSRLEKDAVNLCCHLLQERQAMNDTSLISLLTISGLAEHEAERIVEVLHANLDQKSVRYMPANNLSHGSPIEQALQVADLNWRIYFNFSVNSLDLEKIHFRKKKLKHAEALIHRTLSIEEKDSIESAYNVNTTAEPAAILKTRRLILSTAGFHEEEIIVLLENHLFHDAY